MHHHLKCINYIFLFNILTIATHAQYQYQYQYQYQNQKQKQQIGIGFYNCENFYDTIHQSNVLDEDFLPNSEKKYTQSVFDLKANRLAAVIYHLGQMESLHGMAILGLAEIENKIVLNKLITSPLLKKYHYQFIHFDSKDPRGVDVALVYNPAQFIPYQYRPYSLTDATHFNTYATRDILYVKGRLANNWVHILINHWPSRRGGAESSENKRIWASNKCKKIMDSIYEGDPDAKFIVMGDFNDNPTDKSMKQLQMLNPFTKLFKNGMGSIAYNDAWNIFDQILLSPHWNRISEKNKSDFSISDYKPVIYKNERMVEASGKYAGYPKRTYNGSLFNAGYSDHFPVALIFTLKMDGNIQ
jgi:hypothetical protein